MMRRLGLTLKCFTQIIEEKQKRRRKIQYEIEMQLSEQIKYNKANKIKYVKKDKKQPMGSKKN